MSETEQTRADVWDPPEDEWPAGDEASPNGSAPRLNRLDLGDMVAGPHVKPGIHEHLVYPRKLHVIGGEPGHGKSTVLAWWMLRAMQHGHPVVLFDWEAGAEHTADLFHSLGADSALISKYLHYFPYPNLHWGPSDIAALTAELKQIGPVITGLDSSIAVLSQMKGNENDSAAIRRMWNTLAPISRALGSSVIATDHSGKDAEQSRYNRGSTDKLAVVDVSMKLTAEEQFSRSQDGKLRLDVMKDRPGWLHWHWQVTVTRNPLELHWRKAQARHRGNAEMSEGKAAIFQAVGRMPRTWQEVVDTKREATGKGMSRMWATTYLNELADAGVIERIDQGEGREVLWCLPQLAPASDLDPQQGSLLNQG